jgi:integral membrane sensor domain MASE1
MVEGSRGRRHELATAVDGDRTESRPTLRIVAIALAYIGTALFASVLQQQEQVLGIYWPAAGVAVGGLLSSPKRMWPAILGCLLALQVGYNLLVGNDLLTLLAWSSANTLGHLLVAWLVLRWGAIGLRDVRAVMVFGGAAVVGSVPAALVGAMGSVRIGTDLTFAAAGITWLVGDWLGVLTLAPLVLVVTGRVPWPHERTTELWLIVTTNVVVAGALFTMPDPRYAAQLSYLVLLPLLWAAIRLRTAGVVVGVALTTVIAVTATTLERGPFAVIDLPADGRSVLLHLFLVGMAATALLLASRTVESETYQSVATDREHLLAAVTRTTHPVDPDRRFQRTAAREGPDPR